MRTETISQGPCNPSIATAPKKAGSKKPKTATPENPLVAEVAVEQRRSRQLLAALRRDVTPELRGLIDALTEASDAISAGDNVQDDDPLWKSIDRLTDAVDAFQARTLADAACKFVESNSDHVDRPGTNDDPLVERLLTDLYAVMVQRRQDSESRTPQAQSAAVEDLLDAIRASWEGYGPDNGAYPKKLFEIEAMTAVAPKCRANFLGAIAAERRACTAVANCKCNDPDHPRLSEEYRAAREALNAMPAANLAEVLLRLVNEKTEELAGDDNDIDRDLLRIYRDLRPMVDAMPTLIDATQSPPKALPTVGTPMAAPANVSPELVRLYEIVNRLADEDQTSDEQSAEFHATWETFTNFPIRSVADIQFKFDKAYGDIEEEPLFPFMDDLNRLVGMGVVTPRPAITMQAAPSTIDRKPVRAIEVLSPMEEPIAVMQHVARLLVHVGASTESIDRGDVIRLGYSATDAAAEIKGCFEEAWKRLINPAGA